ncbi:MAG: hypothetical protein AAGG68_29805 [Bacteroidota bacterium]
MTSDSSKQRMIAIAAVVIVLLLGANVFLLINKAKQDSENKELTSQLSESEQLKIELEKQYYESLSELEEMKGTNEELNAMIDEQKMQLEEQKNQISRLLADNGSLKSARRQIRDLKSQADQYIAEIQQLKEENEELRGETVRLTAATDSLSNDLAYKTQENEELSTAKAMLTSEKESLSMENANLSKKVTAASAVRVENVTVEGMKNRSNGKSTDKKRAKNVDYLKICFDAMSNRVTPAGMETFHVRIINPTGETLSADELGSGILTDSSNGDQIKFTKATEADYANQQESLCTNWTPNTPFSEGKYQVQIFNKGYMTGTGSFILK